MRVLVTGAGGLIGGRLASLLSAKGFQVVAGRHLALPPGGIPSVPLDLRSSASVEAAFQEAQPEAVVHSAAFSGAEACERSPGEAYDLNVRATGDLAAFCGARRLRLIALSTDQVLAGDRAFSTEEEAARPLMLYGRTKLEGEEAVLAAHPAAAVVRLPLMVGRGHGPRGTASEAVLWSLQAGRAVRSFADEFRTPVDPESVTEALAALLDGRAAGVFHLGGAERLSRYQLGLRVARAFGLPSTLVAETPQSSHEGPARPKDASLDSGRARRELGFSPRPLDAALSESRLEAG